MRSRSQIALVAALAALLAWGASQTAPLRALEAFLFDVRVSAHDLGVDLSQSVVILAVDDRTLEDFPYASPISRKFLASVVSKLDKSEARAIGLDILLDRASDPDEDAALLDALETARAPVVLVSDPGRDARTGICGGTESSGEAGDSLLPRFRKAARTGHGALCVDTLDEVVRAARSGRAGTPSFAEALAQAAGEASPGHGFPAAWTLPFSLTQDAAWPFPTYSAAYLDATPADWFRDRIVLVGAVAPYSGDWHTTPLRFADLRHAIEPRDLMPEGKLPGVVIHAFALQALLDGRTGPRAPVWLALLCLLAGVGAGMALGLSRWSLMRVAIGLFGGVALWWMAVVWLYGAAGVMAPFTGLAAGLLIAAGACFALLEREERARRRLIHTSFSQFLAPEVVNRLARQPSRLRLEAETRDITVLFTDLEGFTRFVDTADPGAVAPALNGYLDAIVEAVVAHGGVVDKIVGDAVHALFSTPEHDPDHRANALRCALDIQARTARRRDALAARGVEIGRTRIGVNSGPALVGNFGSSKRFDYTAHGSTINLAARLEEANKTFGTAICVSKASRVDGPDFAYREIGVLNMRGLAEPMALYELVDPATTPERRLDAYAAAFQASDAAAFQALLRERPDDGLVRYQLQRLRDE